MNKSKSHCPDSNEKQRNLSFILLAAAIGAILGIIAYHQHWLG